RPDRPDPRARDAPASRGRAGRAGNQVSGLSLAFLEWPEVALVGVELGASVFRQPAGIAEYWQRRELLRRAMRREPLRRACVGIVVRADEHCLARDAGP